MKQKILVYDIETNSTNPEVAVPVLFGYRSSTSSEWFQYTDCIDEMVGIIDEHDIIVGYNIKDFDNEIMKRYGASFYGKVVIDLYQIIHGAGFGNDKGRKNIITAPDGSHLIATLHGKKMSDTARALGRTVKVQDFDYNLFKQRFETLTPEQQALALEYLRCDIEETCFIYEYLEEFFSDFRDGGIELNGVWKPFMRAEWVEKKQYLTWSVASLTYHLLCNLADLEPRFADMVDRQDYGGGFVALPEKGRVTGNIYCLDYNSLYPHIMIQANLYGRKEYGNKRWKGTGISETVGTYQADGLAPVGFVLQQLYQKRLEYKSQKDAREYTIKIVINTIYGLLGNPVFASVSDYIAAADCTRLGRQWVRAARAHFAENGYEVLYTDTDSVYLRDPFNDKQRLIEVKEAHINDIKKSVPFPQDTFDMGIDDEIRYMAFFKAPDGRFKKKNYLYVTKAGKLKVKGLPIIKSTATPLGKHIFDKFIKPEILDNNKHKFMRSQVEQWIYDELTQNPTMASVFYKIKAPEEYNTATGLYYKIASHPLYGEGQHRLLKLRGAHKKGCGTQANYISVDYIDEISLRDIDLSKTWSELEPFIDSAQKGLGAFL